MWLYTKVELQLRVLVHGEALLPSSLLSDAVGEAGCSKWRGRVGREAKHSLLG